MKKKTNKRLLYVAYFYPPVEGVGTPGANRVIKFQRYLKTGPSAVLTIHPEYYPKYMSVGKEQDESDIQIKVFRTRVIDLFSVLINIKNRLLRANDSSEVTSEKQSSAIKNKNNLGKVIKDAVSLVFTFPDFASPWLFPAIVKGVGIVYKQKIEIIFATGMPWTSLIVGFFLKILTKRKLIVDFRDPWVNNPFLNKTKLEKSLENIAERLVVKHADLIAVNTDYLKRQMIQRYPNKQKQIIHIPNGYDEQDFNKIEPLYGDDCKLVIAHAGFLYGNRDPKPILDAISRLYDIDPQSAKNIVFHQIGDMNLSYDIGEYCKEKNIEENFVKSGQVEHSMCLSILAGSDILLILQQGTLNQIPSKFYEYIFLEKHIISIAEPGSDLEKIIEKEQLGYVFEDKAIKDISALMLKMYQEKRSNNVLENHYRNKEKFNIKNITMMFQKLIDNL